MDATVVGTGSEVGLLATAFSVSVGSKYVKTPMRSELRFLPPLQLQ